MAKVSAKNAAILINGNLLSTYADKFETEMAVETPDATGFGDGARNYLVGIKTCRMAIDMMWDSATGKVHDWLATPGQDILATVIPETYALGCDALSMVALQGNYTPAADIGGVIRVGTIEFHSRGDNYGLEAGKVLHHATITNTTTSTAVDNAAATSAQYSAILHIWTATTADTYAVKVQHSTDNNTWADLATFTLDGQTTTAERLTGTSVNRYRRIVATRTGAGANPFGFTVVLFAE